MDHRLRAMHISIMCAIVDVATQHNRTCVFARVVTRALEPSSTIFCYRFTTTIWTPEVVLVSSDIDPDWPRCPGSPRGPYRP